MRGEGASWTALGPALVVAAVDGVYLVVIHQQRHAEWDRIVPIATLLALAAGMALVAAFVRSPVTRLVALTVSAAILFAWSFLGMFSIGALLLPAAILALAGALQTGPRVGRVAATGSALCVAGGAFAFVAFWIAAS